MEHLFEALRPRIRRMLARPGLVLVVGLAFTLVGGYYTTQLRVDSDFSRLLPSDYPSVQALEKLRATVGGESEAAVAIESPSFDANRRFAEALIPRVLALEDPERGEPFFTHVDYRRDVAFLEHNALYLATDAELDSLETYLNTQIESARLAANPFYFDLEEDEPAAPADSSVDALKASFDRLVGREYPVSEDSTTLVLRFYPSGAQTDIHFIEDAYEALGTLVAEMQPSGYHPAMEVTLAGRLLRQLIEVQAITSDVRGTFGAGIAVVLLLVVLYFFYKSYYSRAGRQLSGRVLLSELARLPATALVIAFPLLSALAWTFGLAYLAYDRLNLMTATLGLVLFGMGIDYGIHFFARYTEERARRKPAEDAALDTFMKTGQAIATTALTTASAFFLLMLADFRGFSEFGFIAGTGILFSLLAMVVLMPALLVLGERTGALNLSSMHAAPALPPRTETQGSLFGPRTVRVVLVASVAFFALSLLSLRHLAFEYDFGKLDPVYGEYNALQDKVRAVYNDSGRRNPAYVVVDDPADVPDVEAALYRAMARDTLSPTIGSIESLQSRFPMTAEAQAAKLERLGRLRVLLDDPFLKATASDDLFRLRKAASTLTAPTLESLPEYVRAPFTSKQGEVGGLVVIYPAHGLSDGRQSMAFADDVGTITTASGEVYHAGSTPLVAADMLRLMRHEAPMMVLFTLLLIVGLKLLILRSVRWTLMALLPLVLGFVGTFGLMALFGMKLNFYNLIVLPAILGIGDDAGIHFVHRYLEEGAGSVRHVFRSTGEHVAMSALTTAVGFAGQLFSFYPGLRSIGELAVLGIGMTLLTALTFLPALLQWTERRHAVPA